PEPPVPPRAETAAAQPRPNHPKKHKAKVAAAPPAVAQSPAASGNGPFHFRPLQGPPSPLSAQQEQQLAELLRRYDADQITPAQYHHERAKILGEH
ncbi:MAG TPA: hypothetical protein VHH88_09835, partial [Verrucomicrobiae bacterium]|nr:hypothetical protein [Verrucomicrobiae bacterium]